MRRLFADKLARSDGSGCDSDGSGVRALAYGGIAEMKNDVPYRTASEQGARAVQYVQRDERSGEDARSSCRAH